MSDPRLTPDPSLVSEQTPAQISAPLTDLCRRPDGPRDRQLIYGDRVTVLGRARGWSYVQAGKDSYCGHVRTDSLGPQQTATHRITAPATHAYERADLKSPDRISLTFGATIAVTDLSDGFAQTDLGHFPVQHLSPVTETASDPAAIAALFLGTPYLWGGNSRRGIDCSGLVQVSLLACGIPCPGDSDMQQSLGKPASAPYKRNDLLFWKGHVALVTDPDTLIHANAGSMLTNFEPIADAIKRIADNGDGNVTAHRRL